MSGKRPAVRTVAQVVAVIIVALLTLGASLAVTGPFGLVVAADCLAGLGLIIALIAVPRSGREPATRRPPSTRARLRWAWLRRRLDPPTPVQPADFPSYAKISSDLGWAPVSEWHYDHGLRPLLVRLMTSALAEHHRIDVAKDRRGPASWSAMRSGRWSTHSGRLPSTARRPERTCAPSPESWTAWRSCDRDPRPCGERHRPAV